MPEPSVFTREALTSATGFGIDIVVPHHPHHRIEVAKLLSQDFGLLFVLIDASGYLCAKRHQGGEGVLVFGHGGTTWAGRHTRGGLSASDAFLTYVPWSCN